MCHLISVFRPVDVYPCVTEEEKWSRDVSIDNLFGHLCTGTGSTYERKTHLHSEQPSISSMKGEARTRSSQEYADTGPLEVQQSANWSLAAIISDGNSNSLRSVDTATETRREVPTGILKNAHTMPRISQKWSARTPFGSNDPIIGNESSWLEHNGPDRISAKSQPSSSAIKPAIQCGTMQPEVSPTDNRSSKERRDITQKVGLQARLGSPPANSKSRPGNDDHRAAGRKCDASPQRKLTDDHAVSEAELSLADSVFESENEANLPSGSNAARLETDRIQRRKEIFQALRGDDGQIWGRHVSLLCSDSGHYEEEMEL